MSHMVLEGWHRYRQTKKYSWKSSLVIAFIATILLWWLPIFGPMLSGYVSGRASGSKYRGLMITVFVAAIIGAVSYLFTYVVAVPSSVTYFLSSTIIAHPGIISPYGAWFVSSLGQMVTNFSTYVAYIPPNWAVLVAFGFIGGGMSELLTAEPVRKSTLGPRRATHDAAKALTPKEITYEPEERPHPLLRKIIKEKEIQDAMEDYI